MSPDSEDLRCASLIESPLARLTPEQIEELGREFDAIHDEVFADLGDRDRRYIVSMIEMHRRLVVLGRVLLFASRYRPAWLAGTATLSLAKILENMEIGHNVMHGQWDWMNDPQINSSTWDWDSASTPEAWKHSHNYVHHTYTNIRGKDHDLGYEIMRIDPHQKWHPVYLAAAVLQPLLAAFFEWGVALHDLDIEAIRKGEKSRRQLRERAQGHGAARRAARSSRTTSRSRCSARRRGAARARRWRRRGRSRSTLKANFTANIVRNVWAYTIIFCGHFPDQTYTFSQEEVEDETRGGFVRPPAARRRQHRGQPAVPRHQRQPRLPGRAPPVPGHAEHALRGDRAARARRSASATSCRTTPGRCASSSAPCSARSCGSRSPAASRGRSPARTASRRPTPARRWPAPSSARDKPGTGTRTRDPLFTRQVLYQLSYSGQAGSA